MGWLQDMLQEVPLSAVLRERVALAEERFDKASKENDLHKRRIAELELELQELRAKIPAASRHELADETARLLTYLFKTQAQERREVQFMAKALNVETGIAKYHLDRLKEAGLANRSGGNALRGTTFWVLTADGRKYAVENKLV